MNPQPHHATNRTDPDILEVFHRLTLEIVAERDPESILSSALKSALTLCGGDSGGVYLSLPNGALELRHTAGKTLHGPGFRLSQGEGATGAVVMGGTALLIADYEAWPGRSPQYSGRQRSVMSAPLTYRETTIGAITIITEDRTHVYTDADLTVLKRFASLVSVSLESARFRVLLESDRQNAEYRVELGKRIQDAIAQALHELDPRIALQHLIQGCAEAFKAHGGVCLVVPELSYLQWLEGPPGSPEVRIHRGEGVLGRVAVSGELMRVNDYPAWDGRLSAYAEIVKSIIAAPLKRASAVIGVIFVEHHDDTDFFHEDDLELLGQVADVASAMLEHARSHEQASSLRHLAERRNALLSATHEINLELGQQRDLNELLSLLLQRAVALLGGDAGGVYLVRDGQIELRAVFGDQLVERAPLGYGVSGAVAENGQATRVDDYVASAYYDDQQPGTAWRSVVSVPLLSRTKTVTGTLTIVDTQVAGRFNAEDLEALARFAALASVALENTELLELSERAKRSAEQGQALLDSLSQVSLELVAQNDATELLRQLTRRTMTLFRADAAVVYLLNSDRTAFTRVAWHGESPSPSGVFGGGLSGRAMSTEDPQLIGDYRDWEGRDIGVGEVSHWRGAMSAPLRRRDQVIGALTIASTEHANHFSQADLETLERFAAFTSLSLEKAQLLDDTRRAEHAALERLAQLEALGAVSVQLLEQHEPQAVLQRTLRLVMPLVGATAGGYWRYHAETDDLEVSQTENLPEGVAGLRQSLEAGLTGQIVKSGKARLVDDYWAEPDRNRAIADAYHYRSGMLAPLTSGNAVIGVLTLLHEEPGAFTATDLETVKRFAALASVALENARLLDGMRRAEAKASDRNAFLETLHAVNLELGSYVRLQPLLFSILERAMLMLGGHDGRLYLFQQDRQRLRLATYIGGEPFSEIRLGEGASGRVAETGQPLLIEDYLTWEGRHGSATRWRSVIVVPLKRGAEILGTLTVVDVQQSGRFGPIDLEALERFAALASLALEKAQLLENARNAKAEASARARELELLRAEAEHAARHDPLTGLKNRRAFEDDLNETLLRHLEGAGGFSLAVMDLAGFKAVNDSLGHAAGDKALERIAEVLSQQVSHSVVPHTVYRIGGDEFLILIPEPINPRMLLGDISERVQTLEFTGGLHVMANIGVAGCPADTEDMDRLQSLADKRMYAAKAAGLSMLNDEGLVEAGEPRRRTGDPR